MHVTKEFSPHALITSIVKIYKWFPVSAVKSGYILQFIKFVSKLLQILWLPKVLVFTWNMTDLGCTHLPDHQLWAGALYILFLANWTEHTPATRSHSNTAAVVNNNIYPYTQTSLIQVSLTSTKLLTEKGFSVHGGEVRSQRVNLDNTDLPEITLTKDAGAATATAFPRT